MGQLAQLLHRVLQLPAQLVEDELGLLGIGVGELAGQADVDRERDEVLLGPVVQVALDLAPGLVGRGDDAGARGLELARLAPHLVERGLQRGVELHVVQGEPDLTGELGEHAVVLVVEALGPRCPPRHDQPEELARVGDGRHPQDGVVALRQQRGQRDLDPRGPGHAGARHDGLLGRVQGDTRRAQLGHRDGPLEEPVGPGPHLGGLEGQGLAEGLDHLEQQLVERHRARETAAERAQHLVGRVALAVDEAIGEALQPLTRR